MEDLSPLEQKEVELEENIARKSFTWQEEVALKKEINELKKKIAASNGKEWKEEDTAKLLGDSRTTLYRDMQLASDLEEFPQLAEEKDKSTARTKARRLRDEKSREFLNIERGNAEGLIQGDCRDILSSIEDESVDLILCDPPYGIKFDEKGRNEKYNTVYGDDYVDDKMTLNKLIEEVMRELRSLFLPALVQFMKIVKLLPLWKIDSSPILTSFTQSVNYSVNHCVKHMLPHTKWMLLPLDSLMFTDHIKILEENIPH